MSDDSYKEFIDRFEEWVAADELDQIKNEKLEDESRNFLLHNSLEQWFLEQSEDKPWQSWQPTQKQMDVFTRKYGTTWRIFSIFKTKYYQSRL